MTRPRITFPSSQGVTQVPGLRRVERPAAPAAGLGWSFRITDRYARLLTGQATFTADAVAANREIDIELADGTGKVFEYSLGQLVTAGQTWDVNYVASVPTDLVNVTTQRASIGLPSVWIPPGWTLSAPTQGIDPGDQWSNIVLWFEYLDISHLGEEVGLHQPNLDELVQTVELP